MRTVNAYAPAMPISRTPKSHDCGVGVSTASENHAAHRTDTMNCRKAIPPIYTMEAARG
jgi:hypothetical protein